MPVRDGATYLREAIESVRSQTLADHELIIVDDGSTDGTPQILAEYSRIDDRVRVIRQTGRGLSHALNRGCSQAAGRYLARLDADDVAFPERLERQTDFLDHHPDVVVVGGGGVMINSRGEQFGLADYPDEPEKVADYLATGRVPLIHSAATMRTEAFRELSGYRPVIEPAEDYDLWLRMVSQGRITNLREPVVRYRLHSDQVSTRDVARTAIAVSVALAAARARDRGDTDPLDSAASLDAALLERLSISPQQIAAQEVDCALWLARTLERAGAHEQAEPLWRICTVSAARTAEPRTTRARVLRARADASGRRNRRVAALRLRVKAGVLDPRGAAARLRRLVSRPLPRA
jgi:hypothetical protein